jgi:hypothetical protein
VVLLRLLLLERPPSFHAVPHRPCWRPHVLCAPPATAPVQSDLKRRAAAAASGYGLSPDAAAGGDGDRLVVAEEYEQPDPLRDYLPAAFGAQLALLLEHVRSSHACCMSSCAGAWTVPLRSPSHSSCTVVPLATLQASRRRSQQHSRSWDRPGPRAHSSSRSSMGRRGRLGRLQQQAAAQTQQQQQQQQQQGQTQRRVHRGQGHAVGG